MATWYSEHFASQLTVSPDTFDYDSLDSQRRASAGVAAARKRVKYCRVIFDTTHATNDQIILAQFKSGDVIEKIQLYNDDLGVGTMDLGLYKTGTNHAGATEILIDVFCDGIDVGAATGAGGEEAMTQSGLNDMDRCYPLWKLAEIDGWTNTSAGGTGNDPMEDWDLVGTLLGVSGALASTMLLIVEYTSGD